jgi:hypothetical protein
MGFVVPRSHECAAFRLEPLGTRHAAIDHATWTASIEHIRATPGFADRTWPSSVVSQEENAASIRRHERDFEERCGFAYAVLAVETDDYLGCVYFYPPRTRAFDVDVRSWVKAEAAWLDKPLHDCVRAWLADRWPWQAPDYAWR